MLILWLLQPLVRSLKEQLSVNDAIGCSQPGDSTPPAGGTGCSKGGSLPPVRELAAAKGAACHQSGNWLQQRGQLATSRGTGCSKGGSLPPVGELASSKGGSLPPVGELAAAKGAACHQSGNWLQQRGQLATSRGTGCSKGGSTPSTAEVTIALGCRNVYLSLFRIVAHVSVMRKLSSM